MRLSTAILICLGYSMAQAQNVPQDETRQDLDQDWGNSAQTWGE
jgi:hypothetical protein